MELKDRIATIIQVNKHTASSFADLLGVQRSSISHILNGRNNPSLDFIQKILDNFPRVDPGWLLTGKSPDNKKAPDQTPDDSVEKPKATLDFPFPKNDTGIKTIEKIVIFYSDRTFDTYEQD